MRGAQGKGGKGFSRNHQTVSSQKGKKTGRKKAKKVGGESQGGEDQGGKGR